MPKNNQSKQASKCGGNKAPQVNKSQLKIVLQFKDSKPSDDQIKAEFYEADKSEVIEQIHCFKTGDNHANLVNLMSRIVGLGNSYKLWENGDSKKLAQTLNRVLTGQVKDDWEEILENEVNDWNDIDKDAFVQLLQKLGSETFGPKAFKQQCKALDQGHIKIPSGVTLRNGAQRLFQMNKQLPYLGIHAHEYDIEGLNKVITASLPL